MLIGILVAVLIARAISTPIVDLAQIIDRFSNYDLSLEENSSIYKYSNLKDEIGTISKALLKMDKNLVGLITEISMQPNQWLHHLKKLTTTSQQSAIAAEEVAKVMT